MGGRRRRWIGRDEDLLEARGGFRHARIEVVQHVPALTQPLVYLRRVSLMDLGPVGTKSVGSLSHEENDLGPNVFSFSLKVVFRDAVQGRMPGTEKVGDIRLEVGKFRLEERKGGL